MKKRDEKFDEKKKIRESKVIDYIYLNEKKIHSRATAIQTQNKNFLKILQLAYIMTDQKPKIEEV